MGECYRTIALGKPCSCPNVRSSTQLPCRISGKSKSKSAMAGGGHPV